MTAHDPAGAALIRETATHLRRIHAPGLVDLRTVLADLEDAAERTDRGLGPDGYPRPTTTPPETIPAVQAAANLAQAHHLFTLARADRLQLVAALRDLADWHDTKADKARRYRPDESAAVMDKAAEVHEDAARRIRDTLGTLST